MGIYEKYILQKLRNSLLEYLNFFKTTHSGNRFLENTPFENTALGKYTFKKYAKKNICISPFVTNIWMSEITSRPSGLLLPKDKICDTRKKLNDILSCLKTTVKAKLCKNQMTEVICLPSDCYRCDCISKYIEHWKHFIKPCKQNRMKRRK